MVKDNPTDNYFFDKFQVETQLNFKTFRTFTGQIPHMYLPLEFDFKIVAYSVQKWSSELAHRCIYVAVRPYMT
jgi:hypothetical protein